MNSTRSFWIVPRKFLLAEECNIALQRAQITFNILNNGPLVILDSDLINNLHLRDAILHKDPFILALIEEGLIGFAIREKNGLAIPLADSAYSILSGRGNVPIVPVERFAACPELEYVEKNAHIVHWSLESAQSRYTSEVLRILKETHFEQNVFPKEYRDAIVLFLEERVINGQPIGWGLFYPLQKTELWNHISKQFPRKSVKRWYGEFIFQAVRGPYVSYVPDSLKLNATYMTEDRIGIDILRGRYNVSTEELYKSTLRRARVSLSDFVEGLARLSVQDILKLRASDELISYEKACEGFSKHSNDIDGVFKAYHLYRRRIDHAILDVFNQRTPIDEHRDNYIATQMRDNSKAWIQFALDMALDTIPTFGVPTMLEFGWNRYQELKGVDDTSKKIRKALDDKQNTITQQEIEKESLIYRMQKEHQPTIESEVIIGVDTNELCTSISVQ